MLDLLLSPYLENPKKSKFRRFLWLVPFYLFAGFWIWLIVGMWPLRLSLLLILLLATAVPLGYALYYTRVIFFPKKE